MSYPISSRASDSSSRPDRRNHDGDRNAAHPEWDTATGGLAGNRVESRHRYQFQSYHTDHQGIVEASWPQLIPFLEGLFITE
ncbi:hypothetical protein [Nocardia vinacea]|uniref:hypothetical protein n=1 Tax=Nocardia vinacea TaxID=96468 RepID=UPI0003109740|nr:hypothetical protein [Nocardia vinacea]